MTTAVNEACIEGLLEFFYIVRRTNLLARGGCKFGRGKDTWEDFFVVGVALPPPPPSFPVEKTLNKRTNLVTNFLVPFGIKN